MTEAYILYTLDQWELQETMSDIYFKKSRRAKLQRKHSRVCLRASANSKGNMYSSVMIPGNETKRKDESILQVLSFSLVLQST